MREDYLAARAARGHKADVISRFGDVTLTANDLRASRGPSPVPGPHIPIPAPDYTMRVNFAHAPLPDRNTKKEPDMSNQTPLTPPSPAVQQMGDAYADPLGWQSLGPVDPTRRNNKARERRIILASIGTCLLVLAIGIVLGVGMGKKMAVPAGSSPQSCLTALDLADKGFTITAAGMVDARDMMSAVFENDMTAFNAANTSMNNHTDDLSKVTGPYNDAKDACRAGG